MRPIVDMDNIQIEITNRCFKSCSNCTRLVNHHPKPYFMDFEQLKEAVDSVLVYPKMVGLMGGEPLLHPEFERFCKYLHSKIPPERCGLWTCFPKGKEHYREVIVETFGNIFLNDQTRDDILHAPVLVASEEVPGEQWVKDYLINRCWVQNFWSASINPHGAFFCEIAAALSMLLETEQDNGGWKVEPTWWTRVPKDFVKQMDRYCKLCGCAMPLKKRESMDGRDDISPKMFERLKDISPKIKRGECVVHDLQLCEDNRQPATYKDPKYREEIAARYGMFLYNNDRGFNTPCLIRDTKSKIQEKEVKPNEGENEEGKCACSA